MENEQVLLEEIKNWVDRNNLSTYQLDQIDRSELAEDQKIELNEYLLKLDRLNC